MGAGLSAESGRILGRVDAARRTPAIQFHAFLAGTLEVRVTRYNHVAAAFTNEPTVDLMKERPEVVLQNAVRTASFSRHDNCAFSRAEDFITPRSIPSPDREAEMTLPQGAAT